MALENADSPMPDAIREPSLVDNINSAGPACQPPKPVRYASTPSFDSPQRHHRRNPIVRRPVKETLNARSEYTTSQDDGTAEHRINQYVIKQEIGRGSFGAVHLGTDQFGNEYAVKEFSKSRLRKRAQSHLLRKPRGPRRPDAGLNSPLHRNPSGNDAEKVGNALYLIKEEIAIMKKLNHHNLVSLIEVLDDPSEDSLYMVMEMCKKGVVMKVGLEERADPYDDERCRYWFRDLILGIEYLHAQGIVHRDIKPDNCLVTNDDVLKVVDFGVSEMFEKDSNMFTAKSAGSPAFLPPELCVVKHGDVSGKATDIWSMGVTLYCLRYGRIPFEKQSIFELYDSIRNDPLNCEGEPDEDFKDLMFQILEKDPAKRITMGKLREHAWVTKRGLDPLLSEQENTAQIVDPPTEEEMNAAITKNMNHIIAVMKAVRNFKRLLGPARAETPMQSILGQEYETHFVEPPLEMEPDESFGIRDMPAANKSQSLNTYNRKAWERDDVIQGYHQQREQHDSNEGLESDRSGSLSRTDPILSGGSKNIPNIRPERKDSGSIHIVKIKGDSDDMQAVSTPQSQSPGIPLSRASSTTAKRSLEGTRGHARDPLEEEFPYLYIGPSTYTGSSPNDADDADPGVILEEPDSLLAEGPESGLVVDPGPIVSESPGAAEFDIYETAYSQEVERIRQRGPPRQGTMHRFYLTRRVDRRDDIKKLLGDETSTTTTLGFGERKRVRPSIGSAVSLLRAQLDEQRRQEAAAASNAQEQPSSSIPSASNPEPSASASDTAATAEPETLSPSEDSKLKFQGLLDRVRNNQDP